MREGKTKIGFRTYFGLTVFLFAFFANLVFCVDLKKTEIKVVNDYNRYMVLNPNATLNAFNKVRLAKGNIVFSIGERIQGDHLILAYTEETEFNLLTDVEVSLWYPAEGHDGLIISYVKIYTDLTTYDADVYFVNGGGIWHTYAEMLMVANKTRKYGYLIFLYGY